MQSIAGGMAGAQEFSIPPASNFTCRKLTRQRARMIEDHPSPDAWLRQAALPCRPEHCIDSGISPSRPSARVSSSPAFADYRDSPSPLVRRS